MQLTKRLVMSAAGAVVGVGLVGLLVAKHFEPPPRPYVPTAVARVGDVVENALGITFDSVDPEKKQLLFKDKTGVTVPRRY